MMGVPVQLTGFVAQASPVLNLQDTYLFIRLLPLIFVLSHNPTLWDSLICAARGASSASSTYFLNIDMLGGIEIILAICVVMIIPSLTTTNSFEASILVLLGFIFQYYMLHSTDLLTFFITLEAQNFCFFVLCGMLPFAFSNRHNISMSIEVGLKYLLLSAFSSGILLYGSSLLYIQTGSLSFSVFSDCIGGSLNCPAGQDTLFSEQPNTVQISASTLLLPYTEDVIKTGINMVSGVNSFAAVLILCSILFKLGVAPYHLWMYQIYSGTHRTLILYITTIPKLCILAFWMLHLQGILSNYTLILFSLLSGFIGSTAFTQPNLRYLLVYSSISEMGLLVAALETAGYNALLQHLSIYIISQFLLWNIYSSGPLIHRLFPFLAISLAGIPPLAGFIGKAWIFWHLSTYNAVTLLVFALLFAFVSIVFYLRLIRLSWNSSPKGNKTLPISDMFIMRNVLPSSNINTTDNNARPTGFASVDVFVFSSQGNSTITRVYLTSTCVVLLVILPIFLMKPFF